MRDGRRPKIGLALGSGGARGWAHVGVLRALREMGIVPDVVAGASIGALVGAVWAAGRFEAFEREIGALNLLALSRFFVEPRFWVQGIYSGKTVMRWLERPDLLGDRTFADLPIPFAAVATDFYREEAVTLREGKLSEAVRASISIPGVFDPVSREGRILVDGGLTDPVPVAAARALGAEVVIAVDLNGDAATPPARPPNLLATLLQTERLVENALSRLTLAQRPADVLIRPKTGPIQTLDFLGGRAALAAGEEAVRAARPALEEALER